MAPSNDESAKPNAKPATSGWLKDNRIDITIDRTNLYILTGESGMPFALTCLTVVSIAATALGIVRIAFNAKA